MRIWKKKQLVYIDVFEKRSPFVLEEIFKEKKITFQLSNPQFLYIHVLFLMYYHYLKSFVVVIIFIDH